MSNQITEFHKWVTGDGMLDTIRKVLPGRQGAEGFALKLYSYAKQNPKILNCSVDSQTNCVVTAAMLGLWPDSTSQLIHFIPFKGRLTVVLGYKGLIDLMHRAGNVISVDPEVVRHGDEFNFERGTMPFIKHRPVWQDHVQESKEAREGEHTLGPIIAAYAVVTFKGGFKKFSVMPWSKIATIRNGSSGYKAHDQSCVWNKHADEMAMKTAIRAAAKYVPYQPQLALAMAADDRGYQGDDPDREEYDLEVEAVDKTKEHKAEAMADKIDSTDWGLFGAKITKMRTWASVPSVEAAEIMGVKEEQMMDLEMGDGWPYQGDRENALRKFCEACGKPEELAVLISMLD